MSANAAECPPANAPVSVRRRKMQGLHYFYVGRVERGLLALFILNFITIGWVIDTFTIMIGNFKDDKGNYLRV